MQVEHPRGFVTQYKYRDHSFEDTLKPAPALAKLEATKNLEAFVRPDGQVVVLRKGSQAQFREKRTGEETQAQVKEEDRSRGGLMRKVHSANLEASIQGRVSQPKGKEGSYLDSVKELDPWKPGNARCQLLDKKTYQPVIHPKPIVPAPFKRIPPSLLHKKNLEEFRRHIYSNNRQLYIVNNKVLQEFPPRYFYDHRKPQFDFFKANKTQDGFRSTDTTARRTTKHNRPSTIELKLPKEAKVEEPNKLHRNKTVSMSNFPNVNISNH